MSDLTDWINERRKVHNAATEGPWGIGSWRDRSFQHHMTIEPEQGHRTIGDVTDDHRGNATAIVDAHNALPALLTAVEKVLELHQPDECDECETCIAFDGNGLEWPCPTVRAVQSAIEGTSND